MAHVLNVLSRKDLQRVAKRGFGGRMRRVAGLCVGLLRRFLRRPLWLAFPGRGSLQRRLLEVFIPHLQVMLAGQDRLH